MAFSFFNKFTKIWNNIYSYIKSLETNFWKFSGPEIWCDPRFSFSKCLSLSDLALSPSLSPDSGLLLPWLLGLLWLSSHSLSLEETGKGIKASSLKLLLAPQRNLGGGGGLHANIIPCDSCFFLATREQLPTLSLKPWTVLPFLTVELWNDCLCASWNLRDSVRFITKASQLYVSILTALLWIQDVLWD